MSIRRHLADRAASKAGEAPNVPFQFLSATPAPIPPSVDTRRTTSSPLGNLCSNTPLNPPSAKTRKYSCEENCPTGALLRVSPRVYFDEIQKIEGVIFKDDTHVVSKHVAPRPQEAAGSTAALR
ncbi:MAG: hypothetical protein U0Q11_25530 [Vicinamibacterales bacterium]